MSGGPQAGNHSCLSHGEATSNFNELFEKTYNEKTYNDIFEKTYNDIFEGLEKDEFLIFVLGLGFQGGS